jgi:hypothetical protein
MYVRNTVSFRGAVQRLCSNTVLGTPLKEFFQRCFSFLKAPWFGL